MFSNFVKEIGKIDYKSLSLHRFLLGTILLCFYFQTFRDYNSFYSDNGILKLIDNIYYNPRQWSFFHIINNSIFHFLLITIGALTSIIIVFQRGNKIIFFINWCVLLSIYNRNVQVVSGADYYMSAILFINIFISIKEKNIKKSTVAQKKNLPASTFSCLATVAIVFQILFLYHFSGLHKLNSESWTSSFTAIENFLSSNVIRRENFIVSFLINQKILLKFFTFLTVAGEIILPILFLIFYKNHWMKLLFVFSFVAFHLGLILTSKLNYFPYVCIAALCILLPTNFWNFKNSLSSKFRKYKF